MKLFKFYHKGKHIYFQKLIFLKVHLKFQTVSYNNILKNKMFQNFKNIQVFRFYYKKLQMYTKLFLMKTISKKIFKTSIRKYQNNKNNKILNNNN